MERLTTDGIVVPQIAADFADDHGHAVGGEFHHLAGVKMIDGFDQADAPYLEEIVQVFAPVGKALDHGSAPAAGSRLSALPPGFFIPLLDPF